MAPGGTSLFFYLALRQIWLTVLRVAAEIGFYGRLEDTHKSDLVSRMNKYGFKLLSGEGCM